MSGWRARRCCADGPRSRRLIAEPVVPPEGAVAMPWVGEVDPGPLVREPPRSERVARHEAGHCVAAIGLGGAVEQVQVDGSPLAQIDHSKLTWFEKSVVFEVADVCANLCVNWIDSPEDDELLAHVSAIRGTSFGPCDRCQAFLQIVKNVGVSRPDEAHVACYRKIERECIRIASLLEFRNAAEALADELMEYGIVRGNRVHEIVEHYVPRGSLKVNAY